MNAHERFSIQVIIGVGIYIVNDGLAILVQREFDTGALHIICCEERLSAAQKRGFKACDDLEHRRHIADGAGLYQTKLKRTSSDHAHSVMQLAANKYHACDRAIWVRQVFPDQPDVMSVRPCLQFWPTGAEIVHILDQRDAKAFASPIWLQDKRYLAKRFRRDLNLICTNGSDGARGRTLWAASAAYSAALLISRRLALRPLKTL